MKKSLKKLQHYEKYEEFFHEIQRKKIENDTPCFNTNQTKIILFWKKSLSDGIMDGSGYQPFESCFHKSCYITRNISLLDDPNYGVDGIIFIGAQRNLDDLEKIKTFKQSDELIQQYNKGIQPRIILFMMVRFEKICVILTYIRCFFLASFNINKRLYGLCCLWNAGPVIKSFR